MGKLENRIDWSAGGFLSAENDLDGRGIVVGRENGFHFLEQRRRQVDVVGFARLLVMEMRVRMEIRAITRRAAFEIHRANEVAMHERFEAVVNGGERDGRQLVEEKWRSAQPLEAAASASFGSNSQKAC